MIHLLPPLALDGRFSAQDFPDATSPATPEQHDRASYRVIEHDADDSSRRQP